MSASVTTTDAILGLVLSPAAVLIPRLQNTGPVFKDDLANTPRLTRGEFAVSRENDTLEPDLEGTSRCRRSRGARQPGQRAVAHQNNDPSHTIDLSPVGPFTILRQQYHHRRALRLGKALRDRLFEQASIYAITERCFVVPAYVTHTLRTGHTPQCATRAVHTSAPNSMSA